MRVTQVQTLLSLYGEASASRVESIATALRAEAMLPKGGRGPYAPAAASDEIARFAFVAAAAPRVADAVDVARLATELVDERGMSIEAALVQIIGDAHRAYAVRRMVAAVAVPMAELELRDGTSRFFFRAQMWETPHFVPAAQGQGFAGLVGYLGGAVLVQLAIARNDVDAAGGYIR